MCFLYFNEKQVRYMKKLIGLLLLFISIYGFSQQANHLGIADLKILENNNILLISKKNQKLQLINKEGKELFKWDLKEQPTGIFVKNDLAYVTTSHYVGRVYIINLNNNKIEQSFTVGMGARCPVVSDDSHFLYVCCQFENEIAQIDLRTKKIKKIKGIREPYNCVLTNNDTQLFVTNFLPDGKADLEIVTSKVISINVPKFTQKKVIPLPNGSNALRGLCKSFDGKYIFISHNLGRFQVPTSQLQQGWMNTNAVSVIDTENTCFKCTFLADEPQHGCGGIWDIKCNEKSMYISHSGIHKISVIDYPAMIDRLEKTENLEGLSYDLRFLTNLRKFYAVEGNGPRSLELNDNKLYAVNYFTDNINVFNINDGSYENMPLNVNYVETEVNKGERLFNDATYCFQGWQSCNGCHPGDARTDGLNWDLLNDGIGNPKNCKSLLYSHETPPSMISGIRPSAEIAVRAGFVHIQFTTINEEDAQAVDEYLKSLTPLPSPYLMKDGSLSPLAREGKQVFMQLNCNSCHSGKHYTDQSKAKIGDIEFPEGWDTPTLKEVWRTAPYLHDGSAEDLNELFQVHKHGIEVKISKKERMALVEYVNSL